MTHPKGVSARPNCDQEPLGPRTRRFESPSAQGLLADHGHEPAVPIPAVLKIVEVEVPTVCTLVDVADEGVTARVGLNHAADAHGGLVGEFGLQLVEGGFRDRPVGVGQVPALDLGPERFVGRVAIEVVGREDRHRDLAVGGVDREVASAGGVVAVDVVRLADPRPARIAAPDHDLEDPQPGRIRGGLDGRLHDASTLLTFHYTPVVLKSPHSCMTISKQNAVRSNAGSRRTSSLPYHLIIRSPKERSGFSTLGYECASIWLWK